MEGTLQPGRVALSSRRGASGAEHNPFLALRRTSTDEAVGEAIGCSLLYSGNFLAEAEVEAFGTTRIRLGIEPETFAWRLEPGEAFTTPEAVVVWTDQGLNGMSQAFHDLYRSRLARGTWRDRPRPVLLNNWEGTYFDFDADRLVEIARAARDLGIELFVLDDGWFGHRDADDSSLGDWVPDPRKLPDGLDGLGRRIAKTAWGSDLDRTGDGKRGQRISSGRTRSWASTCRSPADGEPAAARPRHDPARCGRPPRRVARQCPRERTRELRQVGHEPEHHGAIRVDTPGRPSRASSSTATSLACTTCTSA